MPISDKKAPAGRVRPNRTAPTTKAQSAPTGPKDRFQAGSAKTSAPKRPPVKTRSKTPDIPEFRNYEKARKNLESAQKGEHPEVKSAHAEIDSKAAKELAPAKAKRDAESAKAEQAKKTAEADFQKAKDKFEQGWEKEKKTASKAMMAEFEAGRELDRGRSSVDGRSPSSAMNRIAKLQELRKDPKYQNESIQKQFKKEESQLKAGLRKQGLKFPSEADLKKYKENPKKFSDSQKKAIEYELRRREHKASRNFPASKKRQAEWLDKKKKERDLKVQKIEKDLADVNRTYKTQEKKVNGEASEAKKAAQAKTVKRLKGELEKTQNLKVEDLSPQLRNSPAIRNISYGKVKVSGDGITVTGLGGDKATVKPEGPGKMVVESNTERLKARSEYTQNEDGSWAEKTETTSYYTHTGKKEWHKTTSLELDGKGGKKETINQSWGGGTRETTTHSQDGKVSYNKETRRDENGKVTAESTMNKTPREGGGEVTKEVRKYDGKVTSDKTTETYKKGDKSITEVEHKTRRAKTDSTKTVYADGSEHFESKRVEGDRTTDTVKVKDASGKTTETTTDKYPGYDGSQVENQVEKVNGKTVTEVRTVTKKIPTDADVPGLGWIGSHNPQDLVERLGKESKIKSEKITRTMTHKGKKTVVESIKRTSGDGMTEVIETRPKGSDVSVWTLNEKKSDGRVDSQVFFQGSRDTIVTKNTTENGWKVTTTTTKLNDHQGAKDSKVPSSGVDKSMVREDASLADVDKMLKGVKPPFKGLEKSESYKYFRELAKSGKLKVVVNQKDASYKNGKKVKEAQVVIETPKGDRLVLTHHPDTGEPMMRRDNTAKPEQGVHETFFKDGEVLEVSADGSLSKTAANGRTWIRSGEDWVQASQKGTRALVRGTNSLMSSDKLKGSTVAQRLASRSKRIAEALEDGPMAAKFKIGVGKGAAGLAGIAAISSLMSGDKEGALRAMGSVAIDSASVSKSMAELAHKSSGAAGKVKWVSRAGRMAGKLGTAAGLLFAANDIRQGEYVKGGLGVVGTAGSAWALFGASSWAGPVGWGVAALATLGSIGWDYNKETKIAEYQL